ncbi:hypothetical protein [Paramicrobacterium fandaimingii]|uniref:hypothetical protein n=1 Tax=Paramicrobacterium fandaimingii TaxID=2708079 RepID=UPI001422A824|nr:hypothetical protein [Microbacterium fandaimingii]
MDLTAPGADIYRYAPERWYDLRLGTDLTDDYACIDRRFGGNVLVVGVPEGGRYIAMERLAIAALTAGDEVACVSSDNATDPYQSSMCDWLLGSVTTTRGTRRVLRRLLVELDRREDVFIREGIDGALEDCPDELREGEHLTRITLHVDGLEHFFPDSSGYGNDAAYATNLRRLSTLLKHGSKYGLYVTLGVGSDELLEHQSELLHRFRTRLFMTSPGRAVSPQISQLLFPQVSDEERETTCAVQPLNGRGYGLLGNEDSGLTALRVSVDSFNDPARVLDGTGVPKPVRWPVDEL